MWAALNLTPPWMTLPETTDPTYVYRKALYDFCRISGANDYKRLDAILYSEYGDRPIGELPKLYAVDGEYNTTAVTALAAHVFYQFNESWIRLTEDYVSQYKPLENYSMTESGEDTKKSRGKNAGNTNTKGYTVTNSGTDEYDFSTAASAGSDYNVTNTIPAETTQQKVSTYDASEKNTVQTVVSPDGTSPNQTQTTMTESGTHGSTLDSANKEKIEHKFSRSGNIGVMTATDMLKADSEFWSSNDFFSIIASNIASVVTNPYYE